MDIAKKESILAKTIKLAENVTDPLSQGRYMTKSIWKEGVAFNLLDENADLFDDIVRILLKEETWGEKFSEKFVSDKLGLIIGKTQKVGTVKDARKYLDELILELDGFSEENVLYVPLSNLEMSSETYPIGKVVLTKMTDNEIKTLINKVETIILSTLNTTEEKNKIKELFLARIKGNTLERICARFSVIAEPDRAWERAVEETERALDLFRYAIPVLYSRNFNVLVGINNKILNKSSYSVLSISANGDSFTWKDKSTGPLIPFELNPANIEIMEKIGILKISAIIAKPASEITDFEETLIRALHWFASSQAQTEHENKLLNLITCLEALLTPRDGNPIGTAVAEGVAIIIGKDIEAKKRIKNKIKDLYKSRSAVSHGGRKEVLDSEVEQLQNIVGTLIVEMVNRKDEFRTTNELLVWINDKKLGG